jgi:hypothetical protein
VRPPLNQLNPIGNVVATTVVMAMAVDVEGYLSTWKILRHLRRTFHHHHRTWRK